MKVMQDEEVSQLWHLWADNHTASSHTNPYAAHSQQHTWKNCFVQIMDEAVVHKLNTASDQSKEDW